MLNAIPIKIVIGYQGGGTFSKRGSYWGAEELFRLVSVFFFFFFWKYCPV